jgi:hypothetical protein
LGVERGLDSPPSAPQTTIKIENCAGLLIHVCIFIQDVNAVWMSSKKKMSTREFWNKAAMLNHIWNLFLQAGSLWVA